MRTPLVVGNWKMHGSVADAQALIGGVLSGLQDSAIEVAVCPPFVHLALAIQLSADSALQIGSQSCSEHTAGAHTGEVAAAMLADLGCDWVLVGHSERRQYYGESDERVAAKYAAVLAAGLKPILCVGETLVQREAGDAEAVVRRQLEAVLAHGFAASSVIAYEPVWAIGTGKSATAEQGQAMHACIRAWLAQNIGSEAQSLRLLYGGSVKGINAAELFAKPDIDGALVGGASLDAQEFIAIIEAA